MSDKPSPIRETDDGARDLARRLVRAARFAALSVLEPETGFPYVSRVLVGTDSDGVPVILVSQLSAHTRALAADSRCSLMAGEPGKGDPLAHPRVSVQCVAESVERASSAHARLRGRFAARHPKAGLYMDFADFLFFRLVPRSASLNAGFGRAYILPGTDLVIDTREPADFAGRESEALGELEARHPELATRLAAALGGAANRKWRFCGLDRAGIDLASGDLLLRCEFGRTIKELTNITSVISKKASSIP